MTGIVFGFWILTVLVSIEVGHRLGVKRGIEYERKRIRRLGREGHPSSDWFRP